MILSKTVSKWVSQGGSRPQVTFFVARIPATLLVVRVRRKLFSHEERGQREHLQWRWLWDAATAGIDVREPVMVHLTFLGTVEICHKLRRICNGLTWLYLGFSWICLGFSWIFLNPFCIDLYGCTCTFI